MKTIYHFVRFGFNDRLREHLFAWFIGEKMTAVAESMGRMTMAWATLESNLDDAVKLIFDNGGKGALSKELPRNLKGKIEFLKKASRRLPWLAHQSPYWRLALAQIWKMSEHRHDLSHGTLRFDLVDSLGHAAFTRNVFSAETFVRQTRVYNAPAINRLRLEIEHANDIVLRLVWNTYLPLGIYRLNNLERQIPSQTVTAALPIANQRLNE